MIHILTHTRSLHQTRGGSLALIVVAGLCYHARRRGVPSKPWRLLVITVFVLGLSVVISAADTAEKSDLAAFVVVPLVLIAALKPDLSRWAGGDGRRVPVPLLAGLALLLVATTAPMAGKDALALGISTARRDVVAGPPAARRITSPHLRGFDVPAHATWQTAYREANAVPAMLADGPARLRRHLRLGDRVVSMSVANPFPFALGLSPSTGGPLWWDQSISFDARTHPPADKVFGRAQWVIVPKLRRSDDPDLWRLPGGALPDCGNHQRLDSSGPPLTRLKRSPITTTNVIRLDNGGADRSSRESK